jgi:hypothetical protein
MFVFVLYTNTNTQKGELVVLKSTLTVLIFFEFVLCAGHTRLVEEGEGALPQNKE